MTKSRKNSKTDKNKKTAVKKPPVDEENSDNEKSSEDYGGIPARDLKKNLGCG
jgi:hypothetical protein